MHFSTILVTALALLTPALAAPTDAAAPIVSKRYVPGNCGVHVRQYQRHEGNENPTGNYLFGVTIYDGAQHQIGAGTQYIPSGRTGDFDSQLPRVLLINALYVDSDPVTFAYNGDTWSSNSRCSVGGYDSGHRDMDCGFSC
ncbi:hypothetical protein FIBSPDRAFT_872804 [Athelia psychrophila]|uniref:Uncharacterized protein n=1 Tax=Athelia psychrophila TaxID=1759441 RepID=A0A165Z7N8_9AGAM|nr:hypothetical protein FIBSPDRAFT_872804 [Fibularhizoctonia sp. CBS 109695]